MLWTVHWHTSGTVEDYIINFVVTNRYHLECVYDRYIENSTKQLMRCSRSGNDASRNNQLCLHAVINALGASEDSYIKVVWADDDVFDLLGQFDLEKHMTMNVSMEGPCAWRTIADIHQTALKQKHITCCTTLDRVRYGIISVWYGKGLEVVDGRISPFRTRPTGSR